MPLFINDNTKLTKITRMLLVNIYNGNISKLTLTRKGGNPITRTFSYDPCDRLTGMNSSDGFNTTYTYTANSSPLTIKRYGITSTGKTGLIDDLSLTYDGNQLEKVIDNADAVIMENANDFDAEESRYVYDSNGRLVRDTGRKMAMILYNSIDRPWGVRYTNGNIEYGYKADGTKRFIRAKTTIGQSIRLYYGSCEMIGNELSKGSLDRMNLPWGYFNATGSFYVYDTDYQGNICTVLDKSGNAVQTTDYYPYGTPMQTSTGAEVNRYKYGGKEFETERGLNHYDFEARTLIPQICLFSTPDPKAGDYPGLNPYLYCAANPLKYIDPTGEEWNYSEDEEGNGFITLEVNVISECNISEKTLNNLQSAINNQFKSMLINASGGKINGEIIFYNNNSSITQTLSIFSKKGNIAGMSFGLNSSINISNNDGSDKSFDGITDDALHELFHTVRLDHPFEVTQTEDTELFRISNTDFAPGVQTDPDIVNNIMSYPHITINSVKPTRQNKLTSGQIKFIINEIKLQKEGTDSNYWFNTPGIPVKSK